MDKLNVKAFAIAFGSLLSICVLSLGIASMFGYGTFFIGPVSSIYIGFNSTILGSIIGAVWGFIDGAIGGLIFASIYNAVAKK